MNIDFDTGKLLTLDAADCFDLSEVLNELTNAIYHRDEDSPERIEAALRAIKEIVEKPKGVLLKLEDTCYGLIQVPGGKTVHVHGTNEEVDEAIKWTQESSTFCIRCLENPPCNCFNDA